MSGCVGGWGEETGWGGGSHCHATAAAVVDDGSATTLAHDSDGSPGAQESPAKIRRNYLVEVFDLDVGKCTVRIHNSCMAAVGCVLRCQCSLA